jgi:NADH dehydrogenase FAD-containing subunit
MADDEQRARPRVLILGGGFAGIGAARALKKADVDVVIVDKHDYHTFQPLLYQVATALLEPAEVGHPLRDLFDSQKNARVHVDSVTGIDLAGREVQFAEMKPMSYDYLVVGLGAEVNFFGAAGAPEHAFPMYTLADAVRLKTHVLEKWEAADKDDSVAEDGGLHVVVVGGGPTGVESAGALAELYNNAFAEDYPDVSKEHARITLVEASPQLFGMFKENLRDYTKTELEKFGVEVLLGEIVESVEPTRVRLKSGKVLESHTLVWGAGLTASPLGRDLGLELERGNRVAAEPTSASPDTLTCSRSATSPGSRTRRPTRCSRSSARSRSRRESTWREHRPACRRQGDEAVRVPRQGDDGDDRSRRCRGAARGRPDDEGRAGLSRVGRSPPGAALDRGGPSEGAHQLDVVRVHARAGRADQRRGLAPTRRR